MISIIKGKELFDDIKKYDVILIGANTKCSKSNGLQRQIARHYGYAFEIFKTYKYKLRDKFGECVVIDKKDDNPIFVYCFITNGRYRPDLQPDDLNYDALKECLEKVKANFKGLKIASTIMGHSIYEGGGDKEKILKIFSDICEDVDITLYDYLQTNINVDDNVAFNKIMQDYYNGRISKYELSEQLKKYTWERKLGMFSEVPKELSFTQIRKLLKDERALAQFLKEREEKNKQNNI